MNVEKIRLSVMGFSFNQTEAGTYGLVLEEVGGIRRLMMLIGAPEAQSIAFCLQHTKPPRPLTHDLFCSFMNGFEVILEEVFIYEYVDGVFFSKLTFKQNNKTVEIESRTSDAIGIALRSDTPIYTTDVIMRELAVVFKENEIGEDNVMDEVDLPLEEGAYDILSGEELKLMLDDAVVHEDYELASVLRDELEKRDHAKTGGDNG